MRILILFTSLILLTITPYSVAWSFRSFFSKIVDESYSDCISSHSSLFASSSSFCNSGKKLIEECDFDEDFDCSDSPTKNKRSLIQDGANILTDLFSTKKDALVKYAENKTLHIVEKTENYTRRVMDKVAKYRNLFLSSGSFFEIGKAYTQNCNSKVKEYFGTFRTDSKREYVLRIVCNGKDGPNGTASQAFISELKTDGCTYIRKWVSVLRKVLYLTHDI